MPYAAHGDNDRGDERYFIAFESDALYLELEAIGVRNYGYGDGSGLDACFGSSETCGLVQYEWPSPHMDTAGAEVSAGDAFRLWNPYGWRKGSAAPLIRPDVVVPYTLEEGKTVAFVSEDYHFGVGCFEGPTKVTLTFDDDHTTNQLIVIKKVVALVPARYVSV